VRRCIDSVFRYTEEWKEFSDALAFWVDMDDAYVTYHQEYVESVWWALAQLFEKGLLYQSHKVVWWWCQGGTALSAAEVSEGYRTVDDPSLYVRLPLRDRPEAALVAWTTTPWTLPSNALAAVHPGIEYAVVRDADGELIVASGLVEPLAQKLGRELPVLRTLRGADLVGERYLPPFDWFASEAAVEHLWRVVAADFVDTSAGTGIVHIAPAFGEDDFELHRREQTREPSLPLLCAVLPDGSFDPALAPAAYRGRFVKECDRELIAELRGRGLALHVESYRHEYPFCPRADQDPLIQYARPAWYIRTTQVGARMLENSARVNWLPEHIREGRFGDFLRNNVDWALSRERYWGTPLPLWVNDASGRVRAIASSAELLSLNPQAFDAFERARREDPTLSEHLRVHKPWIDAVTFSVPGEPGTYRRVSEVIDCWFDSGCVPFAQWGYPHRGREQFEAAFPADFISEAIDQTRGWFYSQLAVSTLLFGDRPFPHPYQTCVVLGHVCDREGRKESKSKGNYTAPQIILESVRMDFAVASSPSHTVASGAALIAREDYEGLDFSGPSREVVLSRSDRPESSLKLHVSPAALPRRVVLLSDVDRAALGLAEAPNGLGTRPPEVLLLPAHQRVTIADPGTPAPGADAFRWFFYASGLAWNNTRLSLSAVRALQRELPLKLRNVFSFFTIYARIDGFDPADARSLAGRRPVAERAVLDRWILSELALAARNASEAMDAYRVYDATVALSRFVDGLSNWYVRRARERFWAPGLDSDKLDAHWTLYECLEAASRLIAPFLPYAAEDMWRVLVSGPFGESRPESVHLASYPEPDLAALDPTLSAAMERVREIVSLGLQVRSSARVRVRQPLSAVEIALAQRGSEAALLPHLALIREELNVSDVHFVERIEDYATFRVTPNFRKLGPRVGKNMPEVKRVLVEQADGLALLRQLEANGFAEIEVRGEKLRLSREELEVALVPREGFAATSGDVGLVALRTELTPELIEEGLFREVVHGVQNLRKSLALEYTQRIHLALSGDATLIDAVRGREPRLAHDTLAESVSLEPSRTPAVHTVEVELDGRPLRIELSLARV
jgi:isoleucyl-tRNA synthetase